MLKNRVYRRARRKINGIDGATLKYEMNACMWWTAMAKIFSGHGVLSTVEVMHPVE